MKKWKKLENLLVKVFFFFIILDNFKKLIAFEILISLILLSLFLGHYYLVQKTTYFCKENSCVEYSKIFQQSKILTDYSIKSELMAKTDIVPFRTNLVYQASINGCSINTRRYLT